MNQLFKKKEDMFAILWIKKNKLFDYYRFKRTDIPASKFLYYIPLVVLSLCDCWLGFQMHYGVAESMIVAMSKTNIKAAIIVSSLTFGTGHIVNLFSGPMKSPPMTSFFRWCSPC